jgi:putative sporulation protein YtaF
MNIVALLTMLGFALSSSIDNFGVGVSYGVSNIKIGFISNTVIALIAFCFSIVGILSGNYVSKVMPGTVSTVVAAIVILFIGLRIIVIALTEKRKSRKSPSVAKRHSLSTYRNEPREADKDKSGEISTLEAFVLGAAVAMDALTNGLGAGLLGLSPFAISTAVAVFSFIAIWCGVRLGVRVANMRVGSMSLGQFSTLISGGILLLIAIHMIL